MLLDGGDCRSLAESVLCIFVGVLGVNDLSSSDSVRFGEVTLLPLADGTVGRLTTGWVSGPAAPLVVPVGTADVCFSDLTLLPPADGRVGGLTTDCGSGSAVPLVVTIGTAGEEILLPGLLCTALLLGFALLPSTNK